MYFDNLAAVYDHYTCFASRIKIQVLGSAAFRAGLFVSDDTTVPSSVIVAAEQPSSAMFGLSPITSVKPFERSLSWDAKQYFGGDIFDNDNLQGTASANPTEQSYYIFNIAAADGTSTVNWTLAVEIEYDAVWDELKQQAIQ